MKPQGALSQGVGAQLLDTRLQSGHALESLISSDKHAGTLIRTAVGLESGHKGKTSPNVEPGNTPAPMIKRNYDTSGWGARTQLPRSIPLS